MTPQPPSPALVFATRPGGTTIDQDACGGNPFATALIQLATAGRVPFRRFPARLRALTVQASQGHQVPEWTGWPDALTWSFPRRPGSRLERRCALVLVVWDYAAAGLPPLAGAAHDERRIASLLATHGFSVSQGMAPDRRAIQAALIRFGRESAAHEVAIVYCTGHGLEATDGVHLLPGDYPTTGGCSPARLRTRAISVERIAKSCRAGKLNLVFFAGCRTLVADRPGSPT